MDRISKSKQRLARRLRSRRMRERDGLALAEGPGVILEALRSSVEARWVLVGEEYGIEESGGAIVAACGERGVEVLYAPDREVRDLCSTDAPRAVLACVRPPPLDSRLLDRGRFLMALGVQMPGNLGTLIRSAWAFGLDGVVIGAGTVDPWNPKVVRASAGAVFHLPLVAEPEGENAARLNLLCADAGGVAVEAAEEARARDWVLVVGNEGSGIGPAFGNLGRAVAVPLADGVDSLNVAMAGSILMYELTRRERAAD
ncbi:MAG: RNA methyltransferase [Gemmatimonadota bacterium]|nr:RNA methyltransferase [bacterium]MDE2874181.1 RNA methyltransferase [Gemmatimonadota bacterium]